MGKRGSVKELTQIRRAVISALQAAEMTALEAFPAGRAKAYGDPVAAVGVGAAKCRAMSFCNYLGEIETAGGAVKELYGKQIEGVIAVDIRGHGAADCESGCETAAEVLLGGLPSGIRPGELTWEALCWEKETGMFLRRGQLRCQALFLAQASEDGLPFSDFILKGVISN